MFCVVQEQREERNTVIAGDGGERRGAGEVRDDGRVQRLLVRSGEGGDRVRDFWDEGVVGRNRGEKGGECDDAQLGRDRVGAARRDA